MPDGNGWTTGTAGSGSDAVGVTAAALWSSELNVMNPASVHVSEPAAAAYRTEDATPTWSMNVVANQMLAYPNTETTILRHSCTQDYLSWCKRFYVLPDTFKYPDPTVAFENVGTNYLHVFTLNPNGTHLSWYRRHDPCPDDCGTSVSWSRCDVNVGESIDFPHALYDNPRDRTYVVYTREGANSIGLTRLGNTFCSGTQNYDCNKPWCQGNLVLPQARAAMGGDGLVHIVFRNALLDMYQHATWNPDTTAWSDDAINIVPFYPDTGTCPSLCPSVSSTHTDIGNGCLLSSPAISLAIDDVSQPNILVAAATSRSPILGITATYVYRSTDNGSHWDGISYSVATAPHPQVVFQKTPFESEPLHFHMFTWWDMGSGPNSQISPVAWRSTDGGIFWTLNYLSTARTVAPVPTWGCYWSDYQATAPDTGNDGVFHGWSDGTQSYWRIRGLRVDE